MKITDINGIEIKDKLDLGIVEVGTSKEYEYFIHNDTPADLVDIDIFIKNEDVNVIDYPKKLQPLSQDILKIKWSPTLKIKSGLKTEIKIHGAEIYS